MIDRFMRERLLKSKKSVLLLGPRQVGKSTLARSLNPQKVIDLADELLYLSYSKDPGRLKREVLALEDPILILIDEIQRIPSLLNTIQSLLDAKLSHRFILTGSSARKLKRGGANLLPGRIIMEYLDPLSIWEMGNRFHLDRALQTGSLPGIYLDPEQGAEVLASYASTYLREEIQAEAAAKQIGGYARFLDVAAEESGHWINYSKISNDAEIPKETIRRFFTLLEDTLVAIRIPAYRPRISKRHVSQRDRFIFFDVGVRNALAGVHRAVMSSTEKGRIFEQWFILQCLYFSRSHQKDWKISSYRTDGGAEVDLIVDTHSKLLAIECKYSRNVSESQCSGLRSFEEVAHKKVEKYVVYLGETRQRFSRGERAFPYKDFLFDVLPAH